uniref:Tudor domain-containing protein 1 n=1 Tax=Denticeps clupeoides TaxID=299321 RepID=A0AAY4DFC6_9TELE
MLSSADACCHFLSLQMIPAPVTLKFCNYCGQQGKLRCTRCKKTCYCSVSCQAEDWKAHRHICKSSVPEVHPSQKLTESLSAQVRGNCGGGGQKKRVFVQDLRKNNLSKGAEIQATIVEVRCPGKFFIHVQSAAMIDALRSISVELQKLSGTSACSLYRPQEGEICSVKYTQDQNWYRGLIQAVDAEQQSASVLYIDFGNEEVASFDRIKPLPPGVDPIAPCALQCRVAAVTPVMTDWTGECNIAMRQLVYGKTLTVSIVGALDNSAVFPTLSSFLIEQGYATKEASVPNKPRTEQEIKSILNASFENFKRLLGDKDENVEAQPPEPLSQGIGDTFSSVVTHLQSPYEIICQKLENTSIIQEMQIKLREHCLNTQASENFRPAPGTACCSQFLEDSQWYRAKVLAYSSEERVCVGYIDFGNSEEVELSRLRPISTELLELPAQAIPCSLAGVRPRTDTWSEEAVITLKMLVCNRFIRVEILGEWEGRALVAMVDEVSDPQSNIAELLVSSGHAVPETLEAWLTDSPSSPAEPTEFPVLCVLAASTPVKQKLQWSCAELPSEGQMVALVVSMIENPGEFYCYHYNSEGMQRLVEISADLQNHCQDAADSSFSPVVGEPCCARFTGRDGNWYRAMVKAVGHDGKVQVYFVDYGNTCELHPSQLKPVDSRLLKHPFQAIRCCLAGVEPYDGQWSKAAIQRFRALCEAKQLEGRVLSITERGYGVELKSESHIITATLLMERLATPTAMPTKSLATSLSPASPKKNEAAVASAAFALDWKTSELPPNEPFTPRVAAVISPSLFFVMNPGIVKAEGMQALMIEVGKYCRQAAPSHARPLPGAACCALFSGDKTWYRAIVVDTRDEDVTVVYADYGNVEKVPYSSILPVPAQLLQPPFQTVRCTLAGEKFPSSWPAEALEIFTSLLGGELQATAQGFDGTSNLLRLSWGVEQVSSILLACQKNPLDGPALASAINSRSPAEESLHPSPSDNKLETLDGPRAGKFINEIISSASTPASCCCEHLNQKVRIMPAWNKKMDV